MEARKLDFMEVLGGNQMEKKTYTVADILALPDGVRAELLDGEMFMMATPVFIHQELLGWMHLEIASHIRGKNGKCKAILAPFAVYLMNDDRNYVEPDLLVMCSRERLKTDGIHGAVDWAIEIVSPSSRTMDYKRKVAAYEKAGIREYWIVDPQKKVVSVYRLEEGWVPEIYSFQDTVPSRTVKDLSIDFAKFQPLVLSDQPDHR